jgi:hypothetical protein
LKNCKHGSIFCGALDAVTSLWFNPKLSSHLFIFKFNHRRIQDELATQNTETTNLTNKLDRVSL